MKKQHIGKVSSKRRGTDWERLRALTDEEIQRGLDADPDAHPTDANFWKKAKVVLPKNKQTVTIRLDADVLEWFRRERGYQTRINAVLRTYMDAKRKPSRRQSLKKVTMAIREAYRKQPDSAGDADGWSEASELRRAPKA